MTDTTTLKRALESALRRISHLEGRVQVLEDNRQPTDAVSVHSTRKLAPDHYDPGYLGP